MGPLRITAPLEQIAAHPPRGLWPIPPPRVALWHLIPQGRLPCGTYGVGGGPADHRRDSVRRVPRRGGGFGSWDRHEDARRPARPARAPARPTTAPRHQRRSPANSDLHSYARVVNKPPDWPPENGGKASAVHSPNTARMRIICDPAAARMQCVRVRCASGPTRTPHPCPSHSSAIRVNADRSGHAHTPSADNGAARKDGPPQSRRTRSALPGLAAPRAARAPVPR